MIYFEEKDVDRLIDEIVDAAGGWWVCYDHDDYDEWKRRCKRVLSND